MTIFVKRTSSIQSPAALFGAGLAVYAVMAALGWYKLRFGFNFIDEGMYMADSWRLAMGDRLFPDSAPSVARMYVLFNALIFKLWPEITLLGFRQLQFALSLLTALGLSLAVYRWTRAYWYLPWMLSVLAFTGLDPVGKESNLSYYAYASLSVTWFVILLLFALRCAHRWGRRALLAGAGAALWGLGIAMLPLGAASVACPVALWLAWRRLATHPERFTLADLIWILAPVAVGWAGLIALNHPQLLDSVRVVAGYFEEGGKTDNGLNLPALEFIGVVALLVGGMVAALRRPGRRGLALAAAVAGLLFWVVDTNLFGALAGYWHGWFDAPMWFSALLTVAMLGVAVQAAGAMAAGRRWDDDRLLLLVLLLPAGVVTALLAYFSQMGMLAPSYVALPAAVGTGLLFLRAVPGAARGVQAGALVALLLPFHYQLAWADWRFTYFDFVPHKLVRTVDGGFADGIRTNPLYADLIDWMGDRAARLSTPEERVIALNTAPMVHMVTHRLPALNHTWLGMARSMSLRQDAVALMAEQGREPRLAFVFLWPPVFYPISLKEGTAGIGPPLQYTRLDPVFDHVVRTMRPVDVFRFKGTEWVVLYRRPD